MAGDPARDSLTRVIAALVESPGLTRGELSDRVRLARGSVTAALNLLQGRHLLEQRLAEEPDGGLRTLGRPARRLFLASEAGYPAGISIRRDEARAMLFDLSGHVVHETVQPPNGRSMLDVAAAIAAELIDASGMAEESVLGIGVSIEAPLEVAPSELAPALADELSLAVAIETSANAGALAEHRFGAGVGCDNMLFVELSDHVSLGLIISGQLYCGGSGIAGDFGHLSMRDSGPLCECGNRACIDSLAGAAAITRELGLLRFADVVAAAASGDRRARRALEDAGTMIGEGLAAAVNLFNPRRVVVGGKLAIAGDLVMEPLARAVQRRAAPAAVAATAIVSGQLGQFATCLGAATLQSNRVAMRIAETALLDRQR